MNRIVDFALRQRLLIVGLFFAMIVAGVIGFINLNIEAYPDPVPPMVEVITRPKACRPRRWSATSPSRSRSRWRASRI